ncbi:transposase [Streptomyces sp. NPDC056663]|uniref:transposase n=1 Tax=Streptomyces sp. NPDC056663 TaxID=3345899 RepID=UPI0036C25256
MTALRGSGTAKRRADPTDLSNPEWAVLAPLAPPPTPGGRPPTYSRRALIETLAYWLRAGCAWRIRAVNRRGVQACWTVRVWLTRSAWSGPSVSVRPTSRRTTQGALSARRQIE